MLSTNKNKLIVVCFLTVCVVFGMAAYNPPPQQEGWKNLQVLPKDISHDDLMNIMHSFNDALGVKCVYCHVHEGDDWKSGWKMESDDKDEKNIARHMLRMTMAINANYFNWENSTRPDTIHAVTCITCHRGIEHPDAKGIADQMANGMKPPMAPPPPPPGAPAPPKN